MFLLAASQMFDPTDKQTMNILPASFRVKQGLLPVPPSSDQLGDRN